MGAQCNSCGCNDQGEFKMNEVQLDDKSLNRKNKVYGGAYTQDVSFPGPIFVLFVRFKQ